MNTRFNLAINRETEASFTKEEKTLNIRPSLKLKSRCLCAITKLKILPFPVTVRESCRNKAVTTFIIVVPADS